MARACDRCSRLKTMCNGGTAERPCDRCERLAVNCTHSRPVLAKGRPKRDTTESKSKRLVNNSHPPVSDSASPQAMAIDVLSYPPPTERSLRLARFLQESSLPEPIIAYLLDVAFPPASNLGILEVFSSRNGSETDEGTNPLRTTIDDLSYQSSCLRSLLYSLVVVGAILSASQDPNINVHRLQQTAIDSIPVMRDSSRELLMDDALSLCLLSHASWFFDGSQAVANRLAVLASTIAEQWDDPRCLLGSGDYHARIYQLVLINDGVFALLHNRRPIQTEKALIKFFSLENQHKLEVDMRDKMSIVGVLDDLTTEKSRQTKTDYFSLYLPLLVSLHTALQEPELHSRAWDEAFLEMQRFAEYFPQSLRHYGNIISLYQVEACVWFHGILIILYGGKDLLKYFDDQNFHKSQCFIKSVEHSQAIGEAIQTLSRLLNSGAELSPATVYFLILSTAVHGVALLHCLQTPAPIHTNTHQNQTHTNKMSSLIESTHLHLFLLRRIRDTSPTCAVDLLQIIERILQPIYTASTQYTTNIVDMDTSALQFYRWTRLGHGINKLSPDTARDIDVREKTRRGAKVVLNDSPADTVLKTQILALFDVSWRKNEVGQFCKHLF